MSERDPMFEDECENCGSQIVLGTDTHCVDCMDDTPFEA